MDDQLYDSLSERYASYTDEQIIEILKKHKYYQPEAAKLAVEEAIRRGIIHNEDDLLAPEFRHSPNGFALFPRIENEDTRKKLMRSLARIVLFIGILPIIYGVMKIADKKTAEAFLYIGFGVLWAAISLFILQKPRSVLVFTILILSIAPLAFSVGLLSHMVVLKIADIFVTFVIFGVLYYCLFYLIVLTRRR
jgi:hypothetical protein